MIPFVKSRKEEVSAAEMQEIYQKLRTPKKLGAVMKWEKDMTDSPTVFCRNGVFYMYFIAISKDTSVSGYETHLAKSTNLIDWEYVGPIFRRNDQNRWDSKQCAGYAAFYDIRFDGSCELETVNGSYYISYLAGNSDGYEPDPLFMGLSKSSDPTNPNGFTRFPDPILRPDDSDGRPGEERTLYKSFMFRDPLLTTGHKYVNCYNARSNQFTERIYLAVSDDGEHWERYGDRPIIDLITGHAGEVICGDPQIMLMENGIYVMHFFRWGNGYGAYNTFAASRDLAHWTVWDGEPLVKPEEDFENEHAHKTWFVRHNGKNYHYYCAVNKQGERFIALAVSE